MEKMFINLKYILIIDYNSQYFPCIIVLHTSSVTYFYLTLVKSVFSKTVYCRYFIASFLNKFTFGNCRLPYLDAHIEIKMN